ncbi:MAG: hypothetical protein A2600_13130 [Candidatus Lambdaproteobacteria bacterium RIFOXYD1_FULL_56_27]|uniref:Uncharacterized protein n=1 Tax=Candidatus Lambdaproteobacteria bacterium RIFOXYD2_FULL_56_26 TaxID=1817773 RepID=A0A1F6GZQ2_9PROT|nr:MAG: hypothetical protein A2426_06175 [Candidatus Lambdaproteobacteria bacterium RIFOXYC1_FULL_56_13]OGH03628.1 MAG: hypothetical protein A2557_13945 [Candidatus Lambdaproteobacteria bacterium RIFOXYD2_FULL_56_26]OGH06559.1 MAG: hypothetical protein A2600_13130 [Candidatus Lambdaproteobacteria bacterium RIFOXYD1_FULL_56_27]
MNLQDHEKIIIRAFAKISPTCYLKGGTWMDIADNSPRRTKDIDYSTTQLYTEGFNIDNGSRLEQRVFSDQF